MKTFVNDIISKIFRKKKQGPITLQVNKAKKQIKSLKIKLFLLYTLPVFVVTLAQAVIKEYAKIKVREAASSVPTGSPNTK